MKRPLSAIIKDMALRGLRRPEAPPSSEAAHAALLLAHIAWNRELHHRNDQRHLVVCGMRGIKSTRNGFESHSCSLAVAKTNVWSILENERRRTRTIRDVNRMRRSTMIKVSVMYPNGADCTFDMEYYLNTHVPLVLQKLGSAVKGAVVEQGLSAMQPGSPPAYVAMGHLLFESVEAFQQSFAPHAQELLGDIPNYTNIQPTIQISDVKMSHVVAAATVEA